MPSDEDDGGHEFDTRSVHAGSDPDPATGARATPIYQTTSYEFEDADHAADLFALEEAGNVYSRIMNPTNAALEQRIASLEDGVGAVATASGMASIDLATFMLASAGDNVVSSSALYGGTYAYLTHSVERRGVTTRFVDPLDYEGYADAIDGDAAYVHIETIGNPALVTPDIERIADIAHDHGVPLFVDNTFATPSPTSAGRSITTRTSSESRRRSGSPATAPPSGGSSSTAGRSRGRVSREVPGDRTG